MKLATIRTPEGTRAVQLSGTGGDAVHLDLGYDDVGTWLAAGSPAPAADARTFTAAGADFAPVVPHPSKVICVGHNYTNHIQEMGRELPTHPTLFTKFADSLIGAHDDLVKPIESDALDWEVELTVVIGAPVRRATQAQAEAAIAGFTVMNDISVRDWQFRTVEWTQGKIWDSSTPVGPYLVTPDELPGGVRPAVGVTTAVDGVVMQHDDTGTLLFDPVQLVEYVSTVIRLNPGDLIATGTPAGVGHARDPQRYLAPGQCVVTSVDRVGTCSNLVVEEI